MIMGILRSAAKLCFFSVERKFFYGEHGHQMLGLPSPLHFHQAGHSNNRLAEYFASTFRARCNELVQARATALRFVAGPELFLEVALKLNEILG